MPTSKLKVKNLKVSEFMARKVVSLRPEMEILKAVHLLLENGISGAPVIDDLGDLVGIFSEYDCIRVALHAGYHGELGGRVEEVMKREVATVHPDMSILELAERFIEQPFRRFVVMKEGRMVGMIARRDVLKALAKIA